MRVSCKKGSIVRRAIPLRRELGDADERASCFACKANNRFKTLVGGQRRWLGVLGDNGGRFE